MQIAYIHTKAEIKNLAYSNTEYIGIVQLQVNSAIHLVPYKIYNLNSCNQFLKQIILGCPTTVIIYLCSLF